MRFIRENIFLLSTVGVVVLIGGIMLACGTNIGADVDRALSTRQKLSNQLARLRQPPVNTDIVEAERERVEEVLATQQAVVDMCIAWNRRNYQPFVLPFDAEDGPREVPAFPVDRQLYRHYNLAFNAARVYRKELNKLLATLRPVVPPTKEQIEEEKSLWEKKLQDEWRGREGTRRNAAEAVEDGNIAETDTPARDADAKPEPPTAQQALDMAQKALLVKHAQNAMIYAPSEALDWVLPVQVLVPPPISQIWQAQLNYWITKDIIAAICASNDNSAGLAKSRKETPSVLNAAIKELVKIEIDENYVAGVQVTGAAKAGAKGGAPAPGAGGAVNTLTQRASCQQYDVLHYRFTVIMPTRFLTELEQNLMNRNYHTILGVQIRQLPAIPSDRYYGTDPVMTVTLQGELLLLTAWERGTEHDCMISDRDLVVGGRDRWRDLVTKLSRQAGQDKPSPGRHIWSLLSEGLRQRISRRAFDSTTKQGLIREINDLLAGKELYDKASWKDVKLGLWERALLVKLNKRTIQRADTPRLNRALLKAAFPDEIGSSPYLPPLMPAEFKPTKPSGR
ncbi:MAG: hypothetical protein ISS78_06435 [Phycisphaerae bacterium]|nr:hypothetical protein [Phycisphaerae bacterium]